MSVREGQAKVAEFEIGNLTKDHKLFATDERNGTEVEFVPDPAIFRNINIIRDYLDNMLWNYAYLNAGLTLRFNGERYHSKNGLLDLITNKTDEEELRYPIIHLKGDDIEVAFTHSNQYGEEYYSFVNGQNTLHGGTHLAAFREAVVKTVRDFYKKDFDTNDVRSSIVAAISVRIQEPVFESQTKTKLGSTHMSPDGTLVRSYITDFLKKELDNYLHKHPQTADALLKRIQQSERERKEMAA
jgi:topoisomerase IV subunit B